MEKEKNKTCHKDIRKSYWEDLIQRIWPTLQNHSYIYSDLPLEQGLTWIVEPCTCHADRTEINKHWNHHSLLLLTYSFLLTALTVFSLEHITWHSCGHCPNSFWFQKVCQPKESVIRHALSCTINYRYWRIELMQTECFCLQHLSFSAVVRN